MQSILLALWPLFALIMTGYFMQRLRLFSDGFWAGAERLNYFFLFPALLISSLAQAQLHNPYLLHIIFCIVLVLAVGYLILELLRRHYDWPAVSFGVWVQSCLRFNSYLGLATVAALYDASAMAVAALIIAIKVPLLNLLSVWAFSAGQGLEWRRILWPIIKNPLILGCVIGVALNVTGLGLPLGSDNFLRLLGAASLPLGLLCVGAALRPAGLFGQRHALLLVSAAKLLALPLAALLVALALGVPSLERSLLVLFFALPTATSTYILTRQMGGDGELAAGVITLQTLLSALSLALLLALL